MIGVPFSGNGVPFTTALPIVQGFISGGPRAPTNWTISGAGASAGVATVPGVGAAQFAGKGSSTGTSTVQATGAALFSGVGASSGSSTAPGIGAAKASAIGASSGSGTAQATGAAIAAAVGSSSGSGIASAIGGAIFPAIGASQGVATATAVGSSITVRSGAGTSAGVAVANAVGSFTVGLTFPANMQRGNWSRIQRVRAFSNGIDEPSVFRRPQFIRVRKLGLQMVTNESFVQHVHLRVAA